MRLGPRCDVTAEGASERLADFSIFNMADMYKCILEELEKVGQNLKIVAQKLWRELVFLDGKCHTIPNLLWILIRNNICPLHQIVSR